MAQAKKISNQYDHQKIPIIGLVPESSTSAPSSPVNGQLWYDTTNNLLKARIAGSFVQIDNTGVELTANKGTASGYASLDGSTKVPIAQLPTGSSSSTVCIGNDARLSDTRVPTDATVTGGTAGAGVKIVANTITAANIANATITDVQVAAANKDGAAGTASLRTLGFGAAQALSGTTRLDQVAAPTASVACGSQEFTSLGAPTTGTSAARLLDVQNAQAGIDNKPSVRAVATTQRALTGLAAIDGVTPVANDRILLVGQTAGAENGPWLAQSGAWTRPPNETVTSGAFWLVTEGTTNASSQWKVSTPDPIVLGTTSLTIVQWGAGSVYIGTAARITVTGGTIDIAATYVGQTSITTLGTITTGTWTSTAIAVANGGTGATTAAGARTNLGTVGKYVVLLAALTAGTPLTVNHALNTTSTIESFKIVSDASKTDLTVITTDANNITVQSDITYGANAIECTVIG